MRKGFFNLGDLPSEKVLVIIFPDFKDNLVGYSEDYEDSKITFLSDPSGEDAVHPNEYGYKVAAQCIADYLDSVGGLALIKQ